jgi:hypothetical protein
MAVRMMLSLAIGSASVLGRRVEHMVNVPPLVKRLVAQEITLSFVPDATGGCGAP